ncbi:MAG TPA: hypothetical protein VF215_04205 [Thermoanaerobaculia bacterium]
MTDPFVESQTSLIDQIANALIGATPEHWSRATLEIEWPIGSETLSYSIYTSDFPLETAEPSGDMYMAGRRLMQLFKLRGSPWVRLLLNIWMERDTWKYRVEYEYS